MLTATTEVSAAVARAHTAVARDIDGGRIAMGHQFLAFLDDLAQHAEAAVVARRLGLDPDGTFVGIAWVPELGDRSADYEKVLSLRSAAVAIFAQAAGDGRFEMIVQPSADASDDEVVARLGPGRIGIGLHRPGIAGAALSLADARIALAATHRDHPVARFAQDWAPALLLVESDRIHPILGAASDVARDQPHLAEAVLAFAAADMSVAAAARALHLHANSVKYRLERWGDLTGMDPLTFRGLISSVIACRPT
jgi:hypothetical protein